MCSPLCYQEGRKESFLHLGGGEKSELPLQTTHGRRFACDQTQKSFRHTCPPPGLHDPGNRIKQHNHMVSKLFQGRGDQTFLLTDKMMKVWKQSRHRIFDLLIALVKPSSFYRVMKKQIDCCHFIQTKPLILVQSRFCR